ncbi:T9SS type A sorting domain-containing protein [bacterium SCSIO 12741]|nr:T9SS type A sorting domain-containing protein [bacterium SCSIO 12741]
MATLFFRWLIVGFLIVLTTYVKGQNVLISDSNSPAEPCIMIDPKRPHVLMAATVLNNYYRSSDTGYTWTEHALTSSFGVWGDPVLVVDTAGRFYFSHLSNPPQGHWIDRIVIQRSDDDGANWTDGTFPDTSGKTQHDKQWMAVDRSNNHLYMTWTRFDEYGSNSPSDSSVILFSKSTDLGASWTKPLRINKVAGDCIDDDNTVEGAVPAVGPNGEVYVAWAGPAGLVFDKSLDGGDTWLDDEIAIDPMPGGWNLTIPGLNRSNGLPVTACDVSSGPHRGTIYVNWADQRNGPDDTDIWLSRSVNGGQTWSPPIQVNNSQVKTHQFLTWMAVDQTNGELWFVYYSRESEWDNVTDVVLAHSSDGGNTFEHEVISESSFIPSPGVFFGDYTNIVAHDGIVRPIWSRMDNGRLSVWTDVTPRRTNLSIAQNQSAVPLESIQSYPNPVVDVSYVSFKLRGESVVSLEIFDVLGKSKGKLLNQENLGYGKHIYSLERSAWNMEPGIYFYRLTVNGRSSTRKMIVSER